MSLVLYKKNNHYFKIITISTFQCEILVTICLCKLSVVQGTLQTNALKLSSVFGSLRLGCFMLYQSVVDISNL